MDRITARALNEEFGKMVEEFCRKHNLEKVNCRLTYNDASLDWKISTKALDANGERKISEYDENRARRFLIMKGIKAPEKVLGTEVEIGGIGRCKIIGFNSRSPKYAFTVRTATGKEYRTTAYSLKF